MTAIIRIGMSRFLLIFFVCAISLPLAARDICDPTDEEVSEMLADYTKSVFYVWLRDLTEPELFGTASLVNDSGYFLTAWHVVKFPSIHDLGISLKSPYYIDEGIEYFDAVVVAKDEENDLALLKVNPDEWKKHKWISTSGPIKLNYDFKKIIFSGNYIGYKSGGSFPQISRYETKYINGPNEKYLEMQGTPLYGNSGSLLLNERGLGVGVATQRTFTNSETDDIEDSLEKNSMGHEFLAVPIRGALELFNQIPMSDSAQKYLEGIINLESSGKLRYILMNSSDIDQFQAYRLLTALPKLKEMHPKSFNFYINNNSIEDLKEYAENLCVNASLTYFLSNVR